MKRKQVEELLYQSLETERGGIQIYETAVRCSVNDDLKKEWGEYLEQTRNHEVVMLRGSTPSSSTPRQRPLGARSSGARARGS